MAKNTDQMPVDAGGSGGLLDSVKGVLTIAAITGVGISLAYGAGRTVSDKVIHAVRKQERKNEREKRRESRERKREAKRQEKALERRRKQARFDRMLSHIFKKS